MAIQELTLDMIEDHLDVLEHADTVIYPIETVESIKQPLLDMLRDAVLRECSLDDPPDKIDDEVRDDVDDFFAEHAEFFFSTAACYAHGRYGLGYEGDDPIIVLTLETKSHSACSYRVLMSASNYSGSSNSGNAWLVLPSGQSVHFMCGVQDDVETAVICGVDEMFADDAWAAFLNAAPLIDACDLSFDLGVIEFDLLAAGVQ